MESFLPLRDVLSQWKDRRKWIQKPLFPGYLFVQAQRSDLYQVTTTRGVSYIVGNGMARPPVPVPNEHVQALRRMVEQEYPVMPWPLLRKGTRVRVTAGPLAGVETYIVEWKKNKKSYLVVTVELLGRSVAVEIDPYCVEVIS
jgi:transcription antitermination factor NusG